MARAVSDRRQDRSSTVVAWVVGFLIFFPILWTIITSFKTELEAFSTPPKFLFFDWTTGELHASCRSAPTICASR